MTYFKNVYKLTSKNNKANNVVNEQTATVGVQLQENVAIKLNMDVSTWQIWCHVKKKGSTEYHNVLMTHF